ncbi:MAG: glycerol-3-phosphate 1-O-acyltransferase PlsY [Bacillus sp. (in: firmicutes)]
MMIFLVILLAYLIGSIPSGLWVGKLFHGIDIREHGSGNLGATNTFRTLGVKAGLAVTLMDILKGTLATLLPVLMGVDLHLLIPGIAAVIGHMFPIFAGFRGGKAVATSGGILLAYAPLLFIGMVLVFFISLFLTKYVSLSSMITAVVAFIVSLFYKDVPLIIVISVLAIFIIYRHRANIKRIMDGTEPKVKWMSKRS